MSKNNLPANVAIKRALTIGPRQQRKRKMQVGAGILGSAFNLGKSLLSPSISKKRIWHLFKCHDFRNSKKNIRRRT